MDAYRVVGMCGIADRLNGHKDRLPITNYWLPRQSLIVLMRGTPQDVWKATIEEHSRTVGLY